MRALFSYWSFDPAETGFIALLCIVYLYAVNFNLKKQSLCFFAGTTLLIICIASPLHFLGRNYLFSAHMLAHTLILLVAAPLLVAGISEKNRFENTFISFSKWTMKYPFACWITGVATMWFWHLPAVFNRLFMANGNLAASAHSMNLLSYLHLLSLLTAGIIFCWPIISPYVLYRIHPICGVAYLASACVSCSLLGLLITFAPPGTYTHYTNIYDAYGLLPMIRNDWKISAAMDLQAGGLIMWVPCCFIYLSASMYLLIKWFDNKSATPLIEPMNVLK